MKDVNFTATGKIPPPSKVSAAALKLLEMLYRGSVFTIRYSYGDVSSQLDGHSIPTWAWDAYEAELCYYGYMEDTVEFPGVGPIRQRLGRVRQSPLLSHVRNHEDCDDDCVLEVVTLNDEGRAFVERARKSQEEGGS